jgi:hypothetical protein
MQRTHYPERRRHLRVTLEVPLTVRCSLPEGETIKLKALTHTVSAQGGLLVMDTPLMPGQKVRVKNEMTSEETDCLVTYLRDRRDRRFVGISFLRSYTDFWHIVFPKAGTRQAVRSPFTGALVQPGRRQNDPQEV